MKRTLILLLLLVLTIPSYAQEWQEARMTGPMLSGELPAAAGPVTYCTAATTCNTPPQYCDLLCEDNEGTTACETLGDAECRNTWTVTEGSGDSVTWGYATSLPSYCTGTTNTNGVIRIITSAASHDTGIYKDMGASAADTHMQWYMNIESSSMVNGDTAEIILAAYSSNRNDSVWRIFIRNSTALGHYIRFNYANATSGWTDKDSGTVSTAAMHRIQVSINRTTGVVDCLLDGTSIDAGPWSDGYQGAGNAARHIWFQTRSNDKAITLQYDNIAAHTTTNPSACQ